MSTIAGRANPLTELRPDNFGFQLNRIVRPVDFETIDAELIPAWRVAVDNAAAPFEAHVFPRFEELVRRASRVRIRVVKAIADRAPSPVDIPTMETVGDVPAAVVGAPIYLTGLFTAVRSFGQRMKDRAARHTSLAWARVHHLWGMSIRASVMADKVETLTTTMQTMREIQAAVAETAEGAWGDFMDAFGSMPTPADFARARQLRQRDGMLTEPTPA